MNDGQDQHTVQNLINYFNFHFCLSFLSHYLQSAQKLVPIPVGISQNVTNKSGFVYFESEKYAFGVTHRPQESTGHSEQLKRVSLKFMESKNLLINFFTNDWLIINIPFT